MQFDYKATYQNYTDAELAAVVHHPEKYQPEAVAAAAQLAIERELDTTKKLQETSVEAAMINGGRKGLTGQALYEKLSKWLDEKTNFLLTTTGDSVPNLFASYAGDEEEKSQIFDNLTNRVALARHIIAIKKFCIIMGALAVLDTFIELFNTLRFLHYYPQPILAVIGGFFDKVLLIVSIMLLYRLKKPGWILVVAIALYGSLSGIFWSIYFPVRFKSILYFGLRVYAFIFLMKDPKRKIYNITTENLGWTIVVSVALVCIVILQKMGVHF